MRFSTEPPAVQTVINSQRAKGGRILASLKGWAGIEKGGDQVVDVTHYPVERLRPIGGSPFGSGRRNPVLEKVAENCGIYGIYAIIAFGGEDTLGVADGLSKIGINVLGWPKTMDNDTNGSYASIGYQTAASRAAHITFTSISSAFTHSKIVLLPMFGRNYDWVVGAAADFGHADVMIPAERGGITLDHAVNNIYGAYIENGRLHGSKFAVVAISEGASKLKGLENYLRTKPRYDEFGHLKLETIKLGEAVARAISEQTGIEEDNINLKPLTHGLRDGYLEPLDELFAKKTAQECVELLERGDFGKVATIQDPNISGYWPKDESKYINAHGKILVVSSVPLGLASTERPVHGTGFIDYDKMKPTELFTRYLTPLLGPKPQNPRVAIVPFEVAVPKKQLTHA